MPAASSSRRKPPRRQNSSDIEEDSTQPNGNASESDDNGPHSSKRAVKKEKVSAGKRRAVTADTGPSKDGGDDDEDEDDDRIDVENFQDQPLQKSDLQKLKGISNDWNLIDEVARNSWKVIGDVGVSLAEASQDDEAEESLKEADKIMKDLLNISAEMKAHSQAIIDIHQLVAQGEKIDNAGQRYKDGVKLQLDEYAGKTTRQKYAKSAEYYSFKSAIWVRYNVPWVIVKSDTDGDVSDDDDDLEIGGVTQTLKCPISLRTLEDPLTSSVCGHSFSAGAIRDYCSLKGLTALTKCPASGCNKAFRFADCKPDKDLAKKVKAFNRRAERAAEEESDAEEVIE
ncbi:uncharacterized protein LACBIDRAFT_323012 [Laccaria bicolor S238N-H82]|uniref:Predicted protein n=1 Tax=Laccaria bicolor (strain S238N-H82 / ATCC MYA-4686) TaxID=486041 RepID=B0CVV0_LACBS|nr:uncharacterized protein LACBIDRAFT_323012 [Laccaria bicolor S238N-H82]EDR13809.1 predicted protein [Laccaria bicolor S238N-H82]|eukprot:XP_001876307.1 predicted protein [Laccaria bicolor S238N-H82]